MLDEQLCALCDEKVGGDDSETWGFQWCHLWFHHDCIEKLHDASLRIQAADRPEWRPRAKVVNRD